MDKHDWKQWACDVNTIGDNCTETCYGFLSSICKFTASAVQDESGDNIKEVNSNDFDRAMEIIN